MKYHEPVLLKETIENLDVKEGGKYIDATLGDGGHSLEILKRGGYVLGLDVNEKSLKRAQLRIKKEGLDERFKGVLGNFKNIEKIGKENGFEKVNGIVYDLGYSSYELEELGLGLSFQTDETLDMRLSNSLGVTAADLLNSLNEKDIAKLIYEYSDEKMSRKIAREIVKTRSLKRIQTTKDLVEIINSVSYPGYERGRINPATRTFQALRIVVNDEIENLKKSLPQAARLLLPGSVIVLITFHSLEDKVAKEFSRRARPSIKEVYEKPLRPSEEEIERNPRSRSAKLRVFRKNA
ncbi:MAG TPA: 16S rRNA (cytosine(1402)-N(4))-methyltransferase RsmH [bacterium]|nr:16S rRNA (cytosine(1402)-N(4))-methyltransferase RsmH [bacterium]HOV97808.1 16S rRNA (cytosine(1402)-N(4))-methyltransferase RsmH [bacterium]